ncbi:MAG: hypothetical protein AAFQ80_25435 [Cyanobacteria bacterium J06621_8]
MKITKLLISSVLTAISIAILNPIKTVAHEYCESYLDCDHRSEKLEQVDYWTNYFFTSLRPEMENKKIKAYHTLYIRERAEIRRVINKVIFQSCQIPDMNQYYLLSEGEESEERQERWKRSNRRQGVRISVRNNQGYHRHFSDDRELSWDKKSSDEGYYWGFSDDHFFENLYNELTDAIFNARHPELARHTSSKKTMNWAGEWSFIRQYFADFEQEKFLKRHLISVCHHH